MDCEVNKSVFKGLIELNLIELPDYKRPHEADRVGDLLFCPYHSDPRLLCPELKRKTKSR